jgi:nitroreductase
MVENVVLEAIRGRRSVVRFSEAAVSDEQLEAILEAGRWAPSYINSQPWEFIVVRDARLRARAADILRRVTISWQGFAQAAALIVVAVDSALDPRHHREDGAAAVQNMAVMAHSLGLASFWAGILEATDAAGSPEDEVRTLLGVPRRRRLVAVLPVGVAAYEAKGSRKPLSEIVHQDGFKQASAGH